MLPMQVEADEADAFDAHDPAEARFFTCHVCGDNWLSVRRPEGTGCRVTFVHQMGLQPLLKRVAVMSTASEMRESEVDSWHYFVGDDAVDEGDWRETLSRRRHVLRSVCTN